MNTNLNLQLEGHVKAYFNNNLILDNSNHVQSSAKDIIKRALGSSSQRLNKIIVFNNSTGLASTQIPLSSVVYPLGQNTVTLIGVFSKESFDGEFNKFQLVSTNHLNEDIIFSEITFDPLNKTSDNSLVVDWVLSINLTN